MVTGKRCVGGNGIAKVWGIAPLMCVGAAAATTAITGGRGSVVVARIVCRIDQRTPLANAAAHDSQSYTNTPRRPLEPPEATTW